MITAGTTLIQRLRGTQRLENQLRGAILPYLSAADLEQVIGVIVQIARRYGGTYWRRSRASLADGLNL